MVEVHAHEGVAAVEAGEEDGHVGLCAAVGLHVGPASTVEFFGALDGDGFALVNNLTAAVIALAWITFGILVGHHAAHGFHHLVADEVFGCNQLNTFGLAIAFLLDQIKNFGVSFHEIQYLNLLLY